jgi:hypothetical protein
MAAAASLRQPPAPPRSVERQKLAEAIARHQAVLADHARLEEAQAKHLELRHAEWAAVERAEVALKDARAAAPYLAVAQLLGEGTGASVADAESTLAAARAKVEEGDRRAEALRERQRTASDELRRAKRELDEAVGTAAAASPGVAGLIGEYREAGKRFVELSGLLRALRAAGIFLVPNWEYSQAQLMHDVMQAESGAPGIAAWRTALVALETDAAAALPDAVNPAA